MKTFYLYKKVHNITGLKYLGKTIQTDPFKYRSSGKYWKFHIQKYGYDVSTEILFSHTDLNIFSGASLFYSYLWNVDKSEEWANLVIEDGITGWPTGSQHKHESKLKESISKKNNYASGKTIPWALGKKFPWLIERNKKGHSKETIQKLIQSHLGQTPWNKGISCEHKGTKFYNNGVEQKMYFEGKQPQGWVLGRLNRPWNEGLSAKTDGRVKNNIEKGSATQRLQHREPWNKGKTGIYSEETLNKIREARKQQVFSEESIKKRLETRNKNMKGKL